MDYEIQYRDTLDYVNRTLAANADILDVYRVCIPFKVQTCTSMFQQYWRPWDGSMRDIWVREMPEGSLTQHDFRSSPTKCGTTSFRTVSPSGSTDAAVRSAPAV